MRALAALAVLLSWAPGASRALSQQDPALGRAIVEEMNRARTNPSEYAALIEGTLPLYVGNERRTPGEVTVLTREGAASVREAVLALRSMEPVPPLAFSAGLARAAADHVRDQGPSGGMGHDGTDGSTPRTRIERYGRWTGGMSENIDYGSTSARDVVMSLIIDDGVPSRGHRRNIFEPRMRVAGAACGPHRTYRSMCVIDHASAFVEEDVER